MKARCWRFERLLTRRGWNKDAFVTVDEQGTITAVASVAPAGLTPELVPGFAIPGFHNGHSHAFQYAMVGLAEHLPAGAQADDFWSWRDAMYRLAQSVTPDEMQKVATTLYREMLRFGITSVVEFHYLHHDVGGKPFANPAEMGARLVAAADAAGIQLTLVPIFYQRGGFSQAASPAQARFLSRTTADYLRLLEATRAAAEGTTDVVVGAGIHSLRAVEAKDIVETFSTVADGPLHLHIAEQRREVEECLQHLGQRPIAWLLDHVTLGDRHSLVHATHMDDAETDALAKSGATVVICPSTEGNLGDGFFPLARYLKAGGRYAIGTDSHVGLSPMEELRWLDYGQRLRTERRNVVCQQGGEDSGRLLFDGAWQGGRLAAGLAGGDYFTVGRPLDAVVLDASHPVLAGRPPERLLAALVYGGDPTVLTGTIRRGKWVVRSGKHVATA